MPERLDLRKELEPDTVITVNGTMCAHCPCCGTFSSFIAGRLRCLACGRTFELLRGVYWRLCDVGRMRVYAV